MSEELKIKNQKKYYIITLGCQMNKSDSERIEGLLLDIGMKEAGRAEEADLIILNTCSVRQTAEDRVYGLVRNFSRLKRKKPHLLVAVTGCVAGRDRDGKIRKKLQGNPPSSSPLKKGGEESGGVDFFFPISDLLRLPEMINKKWQSLRGAYSRRGNPEKYEIATPLEGLAMTEKKMDYLGVKPKAKEWWRGSVVIQTGCSNYCTYCVVPYARGHEKNRPVKEVLTDVRRAVAGGAKEIHLLGQAVNSWRAPDPQFFSENNPFFKKRRPVLSVAVATDNTGRKNDFAALLWEINQIEGINRIGFSSAHPMYMTDKVIKALKLPKMMNALHLPVQSGNNEILRKMNRKYTVADYLKVIKKIRKVRPDMALATDIIVGFSGETKKQFADTVSLYKKCDFDLSYPAMYSPRTGTSAYKAFVDDVPREEKRRRWLVIQKMMEKNSLRKNKKFIGKVVEILVDGYANGNCWGFSREYKKVSFPGSDNLIGQIANVKINKVKEWEMKGKMLT